MPKKRQIVLTRRPSAKGEPAEPLGARREVLSSLARYNTAPDGGRSATGTERLWGPGMVVELPLGEGDVPQAMVSVTDEEIALPVLMRACKALGWVMVDLESGRMFGG